MFKGPCAKVPVWRSEGSSGELVLSFYLYMGLGNQNQVTKLMWRRDPLGRPPLPAAVFEEGEGLEPSPPGIRILLRYQESNKGLWNPLPHRSFSLS